MARISAISIRQAAEHYTVTIRRNIDFMHDYAHFAERTLAETSAYLESLGVFPLSGPIACFHNTDLAQLDVEMGWQIAQPVEPKRDMICNAVPAQRVVSAIDQGPYEDQDPCLMDILGWIEKQGLEVQGPIQYCYLNDTERPANEFLTQMSIPVR